MVNRLRLISAILWTVIIFVLCWTPLIYMGVDEKPGLLDRILPVPPDKLVHGGLFVVFTVLWLRASRGGRWSYFWVMVGGIAASLISELGQMIPILQRDAELQDAVANIVGVFLGIPIFLLIERYLRRVAVRSTPVPAETSEASI